MSEPRHYRSREAYRKAEAYRHIHHVPHGAHHPKTIYIGGRKTRVSPDPRSDPPSWLLLLLVVIAAASVLLVLLGMAPAIISHLPSLSLRSAVVIQSEPCVKNCTTTNGTNATGGFLSGVTAQNIVGVVLLGLTIAGLGGSLYAWQGGGSSGDQGDISNYADTGSNVASTGSSVYGSRRSRGSKGGRSKRR